MTNYEEIMNNKMQGVNTLLRDFKCVAQSQPADVCAFLAINKNGKVQSAKVGDLDMIIITMLAFIDDMISKNCSYQLAAQNYIKLADIMTQKAKDILNA